MRFITRSSGLAHPNSIKKNGSFSDLSTVKRFLLLGLGCFALLSQPVLANGVIIHATRKLRLSYAEPLPPKDFYVNLGGRHGVRVGDLLTVQRNVSIRDSFSDGTVHVVAVPMGTMRVLSVGETASIGREETAPASSLPTPALQYSGFLVGDEVFLPKTGLPSALPIP